MLQSHNFPAYFSDDLKLNSRRVMLSLTFEQTARIASVMRHFEKLSKRPAIFGGVPISEREQSLHESIEHACINCCLSMEEAKKAEELNGQKD